MGNLVLFLSLSLPTTPRYCVFLYWLLLLLSPLVCPCREEQTSTVSEAEGDFGLLFTLSITMYSSSSSVVSTWSTVLLPLDLFEKEKDKKKQNKKEA